MVGWSRGDYASLLTTFTLGGRGQFVWFDYCGAWLEWGDVCDGAVSLVAAIAARFTPGDGPVEVLLRLGLDGTFFWCRMESFIVGSSLYVADTGAVVSAS